MTSHAKTYTNGFVLNGQKPTANQRVPNGFSNGFNGFLNVFNGCAKTFKRVVKGIFVTRDWPFFFPVKCEMANFFLVNRDFHSSREA